MTPWLILSRSLTFYKSRRRFFRFFDQMPTTKLVLVLACLAGILAVMKVEL